MTLVEIIQHYQQLGMTDEDGEEWEFSLEPGLTESQINDFESRVGFPLTGEIRELLHYTNGIVDGPLAALNFTCSRDQVDVAREGNFGWKTIPIATDGFANDWAYVINKGSSQLGSIYYFCHDAPVFLYQSPDLAHFLVEMFKMCRPPFKSLVDDVHEDRINNVWIDNPDLITVEEARSNADKIVSEFARTLPDGWKLIDLREPDIGAGFSWGRCREFRRHPDAMIFGLSFKEPGRLSRWLRRITKRSEQDADDQLPARLESNTT